MKLKLTALILSAPVLSGQSVAGKVSAPNASTVSFGAAVDISADGSVMNAVVGAPHSNNKAGQFTILNDAGSGWTTYGTWGGDAGSRLGADVAISGKLIAIGAPGDTATATGGRVRTYRRKFVLQYPSGGGWTWLAETPIASPNPSAGHEFGASVDINGNYMVVGEPGGNDWGLVHVYVRVGTQWQFEATLGPEGGEWPTDARLGHSVSVTTTAGGSPRNAIIAGAPFFDEFGHDSGKALVWVRNSSSWQYNCAVFLGDGETNYPEAALGYSVAIDGNHAVVGAPNLSLAEYGDACGGAVFLTWDGTSYVNAGEWLIEASNTHLGASVALDGERAIVGGPGNDAPGKNRGGVWIVNRTDDLWDTTATSTLTYPTDLTNGDAYGCGVAIYGLKAIAGAPEQTSSGVFDAGATYLLTVP